jgi:hypothetical protein
MQRIMVMKRGVNIEYRIINDWLQKNKRKQNMKRT